MYALKGAVGRRSRSRQEKEEEEERERPGAGESNRFGGGKRERGEERGERRVRPNGDE